MSDLMQDPMFFYSIAFVIFIGLAYKFGRKPFIEWIDGEILKIRDDLDDAKDLRDEAEATLKEYKAKYDAAMADAAAIVAHAMDEAARLKSEAEADLKTSLARHEQMAIERIRIAETEATEEVRTAAITMAMDLARKALATQMDEATATRLADQAIADMPKSDTAKAKAA